jgi:hypothetical protein
MLQPKPLALSISNMDQIVLQQAPSFSIGVNYKKKSKKSKKRKVKKNSKITNCYYYPDPPVSIIVLYNGPRWHIPKCINVSDSIKCKFSTLETVFSFREIKRRIAENIRHIKFDIIPNKQWKPPQQITSQITSFYAKQENEWNKVRAIYYRLFKLRELLVPLIFNWQIGRCLKNCKNTEDPVTMEIPKKPVIIVDFNKRMSFIYEASTLRKTIENRLLLSDYMFPEPSPPVNLLTNQPFTYGQLISIANQCKKYGQVSWIMESFKELNANVELFSFHNKQKLKVEAIKTFFKKSSYYLREPVIDYFNLEAEYADLPDPQISRFIKAYDTKPDMPIVQQWIGVTRDYYIAKELNEPIILKRVAEKTDDILSTIYKVFLLNSY